MKQLCGGVLLALPIVLCAFGARADDDKAVMGEMKKLEGTWVLKELSLNGTDTPKENLGKITGAEITIKLIGDNHPCTSATVRNPARMMTP